MNVTSRLVDKTYWLAHARVERLWGETWNVSETIWRARFMDLTRINDVMTGIRLWGYEAWAAPEELDP